MAVRLLPRACTQYRKKLNLSRICAWIIPKYSYVLWAENYRSAVLLFSSEHLPSRFFFLRFHGKDPYLIVNWAEQTTRTTVKRYSGRECSWPKEELALLVRAKDQLEEPLGVEVRHFASGVIHSRTTERMRQTCCEQWDTFIQSAHAGVVLVMIPLTVKLLIHVNVFVTVVFCPTPDRDVKSCEVWSVSKPMFRG